MGRRGHSEVIGLVPDPGGNIFFRVNSKMDEVAAREDVLIQFWEVIKDE